MKQKTVAITIALLLLVGAAAGSENKKLSPEEIKKYPVILKAGVVNLAEGDVVRLRDEGKQPATAGFELAHADVVKTGPSSRAEILLNPGSYLRLGENSEFAFSESKERDLRLTLSSGSAVIDASVLMGTITFVTPQSEIFIDRAGLYRLNVSEEKSEIAVLIGRVKIAGRKVGEGKKATLAGTAPVVASFKKGDRDPLDNWSKDRADTLAAVSKSLPAQVLQQNLSPSTPVLWVFSPQAGLYTLCSIFYVRAPNGNPYGQYGGGFQEYRKILKEYERQQQRIEALENRLENRIYNSGGNKPGGNKSGKP
ncbi:MAG TPA: FecR family protein [Blastocatellia bacterium]|nr:FecR family protein [Blastocatellia bacterium]